MTLHEKAVLYNQAREQGLSVKEAQKAAGMAEFNHPSVKLMGTGGHDSLKKLNEFHNSSDRVLAVYKDNTTPLGFRIIGQTNNPTDFITVGEGENKHVIPVSYMKR